jgi:hypothetical protein
LAWRLDFIVAGEMSGLPIGTSIVQAVHVRPSPL